MILFTVSATLASRSLGYGVIVVTAAMSLSNYFDFILLYFILRRRIGSGAIGWRIFKMVIASAATALALWAPMRLLDRFVFDTTRTLPLIVLTLIVSSVGFLVYLLFCKILAIEELADVTALIKKLGNWRAILGESEEVIEPPVGNQ
jgi:peptidoglycan biosynthesis protein MviN/MurJ (putative lipid II flippase)